MSTVKGASGRPSRYGWHSNSSYGLSLFFQCQGHVPARATEHAGRLSLLPETSFGGVETPLGGSRSNMEQIWHSRSGPVCIVVLNTLPSLVLSDGDESTGTGWPGTSMARSPPLCHTTISADRGKFTQNSARQPQTLVGCPKLARETLVCTGYRTGIHGVCPGGETCSHS